MAKVIGVQYEGSPRRYDYLQGADEVEVNSLVVVPVARGWGFAVARVTKTDFPEGHEKALPYKLKHIHSVLGKL